MMRGVFLSFVVLAVTTPVPGPAATLAISRSDVQDRLLLMGEIDAVTAENLVVPRTAQWQIQLRWLAAEGADVKAGDTVAEFDNAAFVADLEERKLAAAQAANEVELQAARSAIVTADKAFALEKAKSERQGASLLAALDRTTLPARTWQENQLELEHKTTAAEKAKDDLETQLKSAALDLQIKRIDLDKSTREIEAAEQAIRVLQLRAPRDGMVAIANHPREGRKIEVGDTLWVGVPVIRLPDLRTLRVKASLSDADEGRVAVGMKAICTLDAHPDHNFDASVSEVSPIARETSPRSGRRAFEVVLTLSPADHDVALLPGLSVKVAILGGEVHGALVAPRQAIDFDSDPALLRTASVSVLPVDIGICSAQACEVRPRDKLAAAALQPGARLAAVGGHE